MRRAVIEIIGRNDLKYLQCASLKQLKENF